MVKYSSTEDVTKELLPLTLKISVVQSLSSQINNGTLYTLRSCHPTIAVVHLLTEEGEPMAV